MVDVFGTLGPSCRDEKVLSEMFREGMTGIRINLSHIMLKDCLEDLDKVKRAASANGVSPRILIDMQGPELRIGKMAEPLDLWEGENVCLTIRAKGMWFRTSADHSTGIVERAFSASHCNCFSPMPYLTAQ